MKKHKSQLYPEYDDHVRMLGKQNTKRMDQGKVDFLGFDRYLQMLHSKNAMIQEEGFYDLAQHAGEYLEELLTAFDTEENRGMRSWLLEIIGYAKSPRAFPIFLKYLHSSDDSLRCWAKYGLAKLGTTREGRQLLWEAYLYGAGLPQFETEEAARKVQEDLARFVEGNKEINQGS